MSYDAVVEQVRALPESALDDVSVYLDKMKRIYTDKEKHIDFSFVDNIFGILSHEEADRMRECCGINLRDEE